MTKISFFMCLLVVCINRRHAELDDLSGSIADEEPNVSDGMEQKEMEERSKYMTNNQIRNEFTRQYNQILAMSKQLATLESGGPSYTSFNTRVSDAKSDLVTIKQNDATIGSSLLETCGSIDLLLDGNNPAIDCCYTDYTVYCLPRTDILSKDPSYTTTAGACSTCPDFSSGRRF